MSDFYEKILWEDDDGYLRVYMTVSEFRGVEYLHIRKYYLSFEEEWLPTDKGITFQLDIDIVQNLFIGIAEIMSLAESRSFIEEFFGDVIKTVYLGTDNDKNS